MAQFWNFHLISALIFVCSMVPCLNAAANANLISPNQCEAFGISKESARRMGFDEAKFRTDLQDASARIGGLEAEVNLSRGSLELPLIAADIFDFRSYEDALQKLQDRWFNVYAEVHDRNDPVGVNLNERLTAVLVYWTQLAGLPDLLDRLYFDQSSGLYLLKVSGYKKARSKNFRAPREGNVFDAWIENGFIRSSGRSLDGSYIFAWDREKKLRLSRTDSQLYHDDLFINEDVGMVGEMKIANGTIESINDQSGHYRPVKIMMAQFLKWLESEGVRQPKVHQQSRY